MLQNAKSPTTKASILRNKRGKRSTWNNELFNETYVMLVKKIVVINVAAAVVVAVVVATLDVVGS